MARLLEISPPSPPCHCLFCKMAPAGRKTGTLFLGMIEGLTLALLCFGVARLEHFAGLHRLLGHWGGPWCWRWSFGPGLCTRRSLCTLIAKTGASSRALSATQWHVTAAKGISVLPSALSQGRISKLLLAITSMLKSSQKQQYFREPVVSTTLDISRLLFYPSSCFSSHLPTSRLHFEKCGKIDFCLFFLAFDFYLTYPESEPSASDFILMAQS